MNTPQPCARWAEALAQASFGHLSSAERVALKAHLLTCPACSAVHAHYLQAAAIFRHAPDPEPLPGLPPALLQAWAAEREPSPAQRLKRLGPLQELPMQTFDTETAPAFPSKPPTGQQRASRRFISVVSAIAAVVVIALVTTALIASHTLGNSSPSASGPTSTAGGPATSTPTSFLWAKSNALHN